MSNTDNHVQLLIDLFSRLIDGSLRREDAKEYMSQPRSQTTTLHLKPTTPLLDEAWYVAQGITISETDFYSTGEPYFYRTEDFEEWRAMLCGESSTAMNAAGVKYVRYPQLRQTFDSPVAVFKVGVGELAQRLELPHFRGNDQLDYKKSIAVLTPDNRQYVFEEHVRSPLASCVGLYIEATVEDLDAELDYIIRVLPLTQAELYWHTTEYREAKQEFDIRYARYLQKLEQQERTSQQ